MRRFAGVLALGFMFVMGDGFAEEPVPVEKLAQLPEFTDVSLSPDGRYVALAAPADDQTGLAVLDISALPDIQVTNALQLRTEEHVAAIHWLNTDRVLFETDRQVGTLAQPRPTGRFYTVAADGGRPDLLHDGGTQGSVGRHATLMSLLPDEPERFMVIDLATDRGPRAEIINAESGRTSTAAVSPFDNGGLLADRDGQVRFAYAQKDDGTPQFSYRDSMEDDWSSGLPFDLDMNLRWIEIHGFAGNNKDVYFSSRETGHMGLYRLDTETGETELMIEKENVEVSDVLWDRHQETVIGVISEDGKPEMQFIDPDEETSVLQRQIAEAFPAEFSRIVHFASDAELAVVSATADIAPTGFYLFDTEELSADYLVGSHDGIQPQALRPTEPFTMEARDEMELHGYVTEPEGEPPYPTVVRIHGGPHGPRDHWAFNHEVQLLATRGYAVIQVNFRGSGGYGHEFEQAGYRRWGAEMQDDVTDATHWAIDEGIADPDRVCLFGGSFGAYATLQGLVREPDLYACGVANAGVYDLPLMKEDGDIPERPQGQAYLDRVLGTDEEDLKERSPARHVERIQAPLMLAHGEEDVRTPMSQFEKLVENLDAADIPYESTVYEEEGHGYYKEENREAYYRDILDFLQRHLAESD
ncbi:dipeptidyl aminopeptidase/acylaminoacyl peptidase [Natronospira proteinivora]|uniref:Dipeptidyl aminopeptidase/acylaminoacyl peptidase n=1 Tax=Natronospira proteinivora TaxID=1807133 RepID=A0ABT1G8J9_9GAMM|nr:S9 family peptidase [Natronospira proteinivora]MCP1727641.1 dipeptidyl aminopeptidase/acylaminoacyl peptidase [Natronospira proteinivora]